MKAYHLCTKVLHRVLVPPARAGRRLLAHSCQLRGRDRDSDGGSPKPLDNLSYMSDKLRQQYEAFMAYNPYDVPWYLTRAQIDDLESLQTRASRLKLLLNLAANERANLRLKNVKRAKQARQQRERDEDSDDDTGSPKMSGIFLWLRQPTRISYYHNNLVHAHHFGQNVVIDCWYEAICTTRMLHNLKTYIRSIYAINRQSRQPFNLWLCNVSENSCLRDPDLFYSDHTAIVNITSRSYLELFPRRQLVYLTPDSKNLLQTVSPTQTYIIGGFPDVGNTMPRESYGRANQDGLTHAAFASPLLKLKNVRCYIIFDALHRAVGEYDGDAIRALEAAVPKSKQMSSPSPRWSNKQIFSDLRPKRRRSANPPLS